MRFLTVMLLFCLCGTVLAQSSPSYRLERGTLHAGAYPLGSVGPVSASYRMSFQTTGQGLTAKALHSATFAMDVGFAQGYPPPGEVQMLLVRDKTTLVWSAERSVGRYRVYGGDLATLPSGYGECRVPGVVTEEAHLDDEPAAGQGFFYLVTAQNSLYEEGTKGYDSAGAQRSNPSPCP